MNLSTAFSLLGIALSSSSSDIKERWRVLAAQHHPDRGGDADAFSELHKAYALALAHAKASEARCPECDGGGFIVIKQGWTSLKMPCSACKGTGRRSES